VLPINSHDTVLYKFLFQICKCNIQRKVAYIIQALLNAMKDFIRLIYTVGDINKWTPCKQMIKLNLNKL